VIVVDIETSGLDSIKNGIWQIGALDFENPENTFLGESRIDDEDAVEEGALKVTGKTEEELRDKNKPSQKQLLIDFFSWISKIKNKTIVAHNTPFDYGFLFLRAKKYGLQAPFNHRTYDLHVFASMKYLEINGKLPFEEGKSKMNLSAVMDFCGMKDKRIKIKENQVAVEGTPHNGLEDAKIEAECISRILYGKPLLPEFKDFPIPEYLIQ
jgi:DNA polymerase III epsilon subunit-like protein